MSAPTHSLLAPLLLPPVLWGSQASNVEFSICSSRVSKVPELLSSGCSQQYTGEKRGAAYGKRVPEE